MSKPNNKETTAKKDSFEPLYSMQIPKLDNSDNFRIDKIIEEYKNRINSIAKIIIPERKAAPPKNDLPSKNPEILAKLKFKKENRQNLLKINDAIIGKITNSKPVDPKSHQIMISRLAKGDTKLMIGIPQLKGKDGTLLNSPLNKNKLEKYKNEAILELKKIDDSFENKITDKDLLGGNNNIKINYNFRDDNKEKESLIITKKSNFSKNNNKDGGFFLTGVATQHEKKVDFFLSENNNKDLETIENILNNANNNNNNKFNKNNNNYKNNLKKDSTKSIYNTLKDKLNNNNNNNINIKENYNNINNQKQLTKTNKVPDLILDHENFEKDSDLFSDENRYVSITKKSKNRVKSLQSLGSLNAWNTQENYNTNSPNKNLNNKQSFKETQQSNYASTYNIINNNNLINNNLSENLAKLKSKENDFFKMALRTKSLKNLQNKKSAKKEKRFLKTNYLSAMNDFLSTVNTEMNFYQNTFCDIEKGIKNYDHIQSVHWAIQPEKLSDKKMIYQDKEFVRKYFIYGTQGGQFISEDKANDDIIERSDNLAKITPEISFKFKKMIMDRFAEKPLVDFAQFLERNTYKEKKFQENSLKVAKLIDDTDKRRARIEKDLGKIFLKSKE